MGWWGGCKQVFKVGTVCVQPFPTFVILGKHLKSWFLGPRSSRAGVMQQESCPSRGSWRKEAYCWMQVQCKKAAILLKQSRKSNAVIIRGAETLWPGEKVYNTTWEEEQLHLSVLFSQRLASLWKSCKATGEPRAWQGVPSLLLCSMGFFLLQAASVNHGEVQKQQI